MSLKRELGLFGATMIGLGSIIGTGVFVSIGIAAGIAGPAVIVAMMMAAAVATCNALSSAQLAANHPVSLVGCSLAQDGICCNGGNWFAGYLLHAMEQDAEWLVPVAVLTVAILTAVMLSGLRHTVRTSYAAQCVGLDVCRLYRLRSNCHARRRSVGAASDHTKGDNTDARNLDAALYRRGRRRHRRGRRRQSSRSYDHWSALGNCCTPLSVSRARG